MLGNERTQRWFVDALGQARQVHRFDLWAYVIMPNHAHVLVMPRDWESRVANILKAIKQPVAQRAIHHMKSRRTDWLTKICTTDQKGNVTYRFWQRGGGYDRNIDNPNTAQAALNYIHENPVRAGLADCAIDWPWSSARYYAGLDDVKIKMDDTLEL